MFSKIRILLGAGEYVFISNIIAIDMDLIKSVFYFFAEAERLSYLFFHYYSHVLVSRFALCEIRDSCH